MLSEYQTEKRGHIDCTKREPESPGSWTVIPV